MTPPESPFSAARFEYEHRHLYFLQAEFFEQLETRKPIFLIGSRGTGKTTLLRALTWQERLENPSLKTQLGTDPFAQKYIGIYIKLPDVQLALVRLWTLERSAAIRQSIFSAFFDLVWLEELANAVSNLIVRRVLPASPSAERTCVSEITDQYATLFNAVSDVTGPVHTLRDLRRAFRAARNFIEMSAKRESDAADTVYRLGLVGQVGELGRFVSQHLQRLCTADYRDNEWFFKVCFDEGECLDEYSRLILNTCMRLAKTPLFFVLSYVSRPNDLSATLIEGLTLVQADRALVQLDQMSNRHFNELAEGVAAVRVSNALKQKASFDSELVFGKLNLNKLLFEALASSVSKQARDLVSAAQASHWRKSQSADEAFHLEGDDEVPPIYQTYLTQRLNVPFPEKSRAPWQKRSAESAQFRKRMVSAYLSICHEMNVEVRYASADMLLQMSDMCIRDFLLQVDSVFRHSKKTLAAFVKSRVSNTIQNTALKAASRDKYDSIPQSGVNSPSKIGALIEGLARITARAQASSWDGKEHLLSSERGRFVLDLHDHAHPQHKVVLAILREAAEAGFLRLLETKDTLWRFRVHTSLAAEYGFSYRGAYYDYPIAFEDLVALIGATEQSELVSIASRIASRSNVRNQSLL